MEFKDVCSLIAKFEGKKAPTTIGNIREVISIYHKLLISDKDVRRQLIKDVLRELTNKKEE